MPREAPVMRTTFCSGDMIIPSGSNRAIISGVPGRFFAPLAKALSFVAEDEERQVDLTVRR
jgi:hypothetical protein